MGTIVGAANKYLPGNVKTQVAVRWESGSVDAVELSGLGVDPIGSSFIQPVAINDVGTAQKFDLDSNFLGLRAVRWEAGGAAATELDSLGTDAMGVSTTFPSAINDLGTVVGEALKYNALGDFQGSRAARWDAGGTAVTELGVLPGTFPDFALSGVYAINNAGLAVGALDEFDDVGAHLGSRAVYWKPDGMPVNLNTLIDPDSGWSLEQATAISDTGLIAGMGHFDPDGPGGQDEYPRLCLIQIPAVAVPEPEGFAILAFGLIVLSWDVRRRPFSRI